MMVDDGCLRDVFSSSKQGGLWTSESILPSQSMAVCNPVKSVLASVLQTHRLGTPTQPNYILPQGPATMIQHLKAP